MYEKQKFIPNKNKLKTKNQSTVIAPILKFNSFKLKNEYDQTYSSCTLMTGMKLLHSSLIQLQLDRKKIESTLEMISN